MLRATAETHGDREAVVDTSSDPTVRLTYAEVKDRVDEVAAAVIAAGVQPGDRVAIWAPNCWEWVVALLGLQSAGARARPAQHPLQGRRGGRHPRAAAGPGCSSPSRGSSATTTSSMLVTARRPAPPRARSSSCAATGAPARGRRVAGTSSSPPARDVSADERRPPASTGAHRPTTCPTCCSPRAPPARPRASICTHGQTLRAFGDWADVVGLARRRPLPVRQPVLPLVRVQGRASSRALVTGRDARADAGLRRPEAMADLIEAERHHDAPRPADALPDDAQPPRLRRRSTVDRCASPSPAPRRCRSSSSSACATTSASTPSSPPTASPRRRVRHDLPPRATTPRPSPPPPAGRIPGIEVQVVDDDGAALPAGEAGRGRGPRLQRDAGYFEDPEQTAETHRRRRLAAHRRHRRDGRARLPHASPTARRTCSSSAASTPTRPRSSTCCSATPTSPRRRWSACPTSAWARSACAFVRRRPRAPRPTRRDHRRGPASTWPTTRRPRHVEVVDALPLNASGKVLKFELRERVEGSLR